MANEIETLLVGIKGVKIDWRIDWTETTRVDWRADWEVRDLSSWSPGDTSFVFGGEVYNPSGNFEF